MPLNRFLLLANAEALTIQEFMGCDCNRSTRTGRVYVGAKGKVKLLGGTILEAGANGYVEFDGEVICSKGGTSVVPWWNVLICMRKYKLMSLSKC